MRLNNYKLINEMCDTLLEALNIVKSTNNPSIIGDCLAFVHAIENNLKQQQIASNSIFDCIHNISASLQNHLDVDKAIKLSEQLKSLCETDIKYQIRVLFVAELGGKWDSMASVYYAMKERDDVIVDVVLQPIFRSVRLTDGTERTDTIYKDYLRPMGIMHIPYTMYDISAIRPDITFISQPYESVTIEMFWPENIAKYSRLVYLPYFSATLMDQKVAPVFHSLFLMDVQKYSWRIPAQSDLMKKHYEQYASRKGENVIVTGLPKWDYIDTLNKQNVPCPAEWMDKICGKTVFLWNTHFNHGDIKSGSEILTEKGKQFLDIFSNHPDIALIWRPHPMTESVIRIYFPQHYSTYLNMKNTVEQSDNMVIDTNETYDSAFVWSDALISDFSSLVEQYLLMNKPILFTFKDDSLCALLKKNYDEFGLIDYSGIPYSTQMEYTKHFIDDILNGNDKGFADRQRIIADFFANKYINGNCGKYLADLLIEELTNEVLNEN